MLFSRGKELSGVLKIPSCCLHLFLKVESWQQIMPQSVSTNLWGWLEGQQMMMTSVINSVGVSSVT